MPPPTRPEVKSGHRALPTGRWLTLCVLDRTQCLPLWGRCPKAKPQGRMRSCRSIVIEGAVRRIGTRKMNTNAPDSSESGAFFPLGAKKTTRGEGGLLMFGTSEGAGTDGKRQSRRQTIVCWPYYSKPDTVRQSLESKISEGFSRGHEAPGEFQITYRTRTHR